MECVIDSGNVSISCLITLTPFTDGLIHRPSRSWNIVSFSGDVKDLIVYVESSVDQLPKVISIIIIIPMLLHVHVVLIPMHV